MVVVLGLRSGSQPLSCCRRWMVAVSLLRLRIVKERNVQAILQKLNQS
jgi:hypothetical protein